MKLQRVTTRSKLRGSQCLLCRRVMREGEAAVVVEKGYSRVAYHRDCVERLLAESPYEGTPSRQVLVEEQFQALKERLARQYEKDTSDGQVG